MAGYTKLFQSILDSTIWQESSETRLLWITMLAMSDKDGEVQASIPGLAKRAGITLKECEIGLETLLSPDPYSRTPSFDGRRIEVISGGWLLLNHAKYRDLMSYEERKEYNRRKQAEHRAKKAQESSENVNDMSITVNHSQSQSAMSAHNKRQKAKADTKAKEESPLTPKGELPVPSDFSEKRKESLRTWLRYKKEKGQGYKLTGWQTMLSKFAHLSDADLDASIQNSMANNYSGIFEFRSPNPDSDPDPGKSKPRPLPPNWREIGQEIYGHPVTCSEDELTADQRTDIYRQARP